MEDEEEKKMVATLNENSMLEKWIISDNKSQEGGPGGDDRYDTFGKFTKQDQTKEEIVSSICPAKNQLRKNKHKNWQDQQQQQQIPMINVDYAEAPQRKTFDRRREGVAPGDAADASLLKRVLSVEDQEASIYSRPGSRNDNKYPIDESVITLGESSMIKNAWGSDADDGKSNGQIAEIEGLNLSRISKRQHSSSRMAANSDLSNHMIDDL